jgi:hypothetical protein
MGDSSKAWRTSSYSGANGGTCVEVGKSTPTVVVRDTTNRAGAVLSIPVEAWQGFTNSLK